MQLSLESLEQRTVPSVTLTPGAGGALNLFGAEGQSHRVLLRLGTAAGTVDVVADGATTTIPTPAAINYQGSNQGDTFTNRTTIAGSLSFGNGANVVYTIAPGSGVTAGNGTNYLQITGGNSTITAGNGNNNVYGGPGDTITLGNGTNTVYDILPGTQSVSVGQHHGVDHLFIGPQSTLTGAMPQDHVAQFFVTAPLGSGTLAQQGGTLYFAANNNGDMLDVIGLGPNTVFVLYNLNNGAGVQTAVFTGVNQIAAFGGTGNDVFRNDSTVDDVMYGAGGSNILIGGFGAFDQEKSGGQAQTGSIAVGRSPVFNDLNGSGLTNTSNTLIFFNPNATNVLRTNSPTDKVYGFNAAHGILLSLYPDNVIAALLPPFVPA